MINNKVIKHNFIKHIGRVVKHKIIMRISIMAKQLNVTSLVTKHIDNLMRLVIKQRVIKQLSGQQLIVFKRVDIERVIQLSLKRHIQLLGH